MAFIRKKILGGKYTPALLKKDLKRMSQAERRSFLEFFVEKRGSAVPAKQRKNLHLLPLPMLFHLLDQSNQMTIEMGEILYHAKEDMSSTTWRMPEEEKAEAEKAEEECAVETEAQEQKLEVPTAEETREAETDKQLEAFAAQLRELQRQLGNSGRKIKNRRKRTKKKNRNFAFAWTMKNARRNRPEKSRGARKPDVRS